MQEQDIVHPKPYLKVYPDPKDVFASSVDRCFHHLLPLISIDLSVVNAEWQGWIHLLNPCEPHDGLLGEYTEAHHNYYCRSNWVGFHLNEDNKYELLTDWQYFLLENGEIDLAEKKSQEFADITINELKEQYEVQHNVYANSKARYVEHQLLYAPCNPEYCVDGELGVLSNLLDQLGGGVGDANWTCTSDMPIDESIEDNIVPITPEGKRFHFIAEVPAYHYCDNGPDSIVLFYEPDSRIALLTFDWT